MTTVTITGSGTPILRPGTAGPGVLIRHGATALQFDAGRATSLRISEAGADLPSLQALFITHQHSDHVIGLAELLIDRWLQAPGHIAVPALDVYAPDGMAADLAEHVLDPWADEIAMRLAHNPMEHRPDPNVIRFTPTPRPATVFDDEGIAVSTVLVSHEPVSNAVGYRMDTPDGSIVVSGDTRVCAAIESLADGVDVLVHEAFLTDAAEGVVSDVERIGAYHADVVQLGAMAARCGVKTLVLTHLIPPLGDAADRSAFEEAARAGGFENEVVVAEDLTQVELIP